MNRGGLALRLIAALTLLPLLPACVPVALLGGVAVGAISATERRTLSQQRLDAEIERRVATRLQENFGGKIHVNAHAFNQTLLLTGQVPTKELMDEVDALLKLTPNVKRWVNEIKIVKLNGNKWQASDAAITAHVKTRFGQEGAFNLSHVKVVTEASEVFLMGIVSQKEADAAIATARNTNLVLSVINALEILSDAEIHRLDKALTPDDEPKTITPSTAPAPLPQ